MRLLKYYIAIFGVLAVFEILQGGIPLTATRIGILIGAGGFGVLWYIITNALDKKTPLETKQSLQLLNKIEKDLQQKGAMIPPTTQQKEYTTKKHSNTHTHAQENSKEDPQRNPHDPPPTRKRGLGYLE
jgi:hypothetical protein